MGTLEFTILIALAAALAAWGAAQGAVHLLKGEKRRLKRRLESSSVASAMDMDETRSALLVQNDTAPLPGPLARLGVLIRLNKRLTHAFPDASLIKFLSLMAFLGAMAFCAVAFLMDSLVAGMAAGGAAGYIPLMVVNSRRASRQRQLILQLPEALDFLSRVLKAGHSLSTGLQLMGEELPDPLGAEFRHSYAEHSLGTSLDDTMRGMTRRIESTDFAFFVTAVLIQRQTGGDLSEVLRNISGMVRQRIRMAQHVRAITAEGRMTSYILVAFPVVLFVISYVMNPAYAGLLLRTDAGRILLAVSAGLTTLGMFLIRKIVTVKV